MVDAGKTQEQSKEGQVSSDNSQAPSLIEQAKAAAALMKVENDRREALVLRDEKLAAERLLGGQAYAGSVPQVTETKEQIAKREAREWIKSSGLPDPFKDGEI